MTKNCMAVSKMPKCCMVESRKYKKKKKYRGDLKVQKCSMESLK